MSNKWDGVYYHHENMHDALLVYGSHDKEAFVPCVGYIKEGKIEDTLYDAFFFTSHYDQVADTVDDWMSFIEGLFAEGGNLDALEAAVGEVKAALNLPADYRATVFLSIFPPRKRAVPTEGYGQQFALPALEEKKRAARWQADEQLRRFQEKHYRHLRMAGFHWPINKGLPADPDMCYVCWDFTDYVRSLGYETNWSPYFVAAGHNSYKAMGFDIGTMQPNYYCDSGDIDNLRGAAQIMREINMGFYAELENHSRAAVRTFKEYLRHGEIHGYMYAFHVWRMVDGPEAVSRLAGAQDSFESSAYHEVYRFIRRTLDPDSVVME